MTSFSQFSSYYKANSIRNSVGLDCLEAILEYETFLYLLRRLYRIIRKSGRRKESLMQLKLRIQLFEIESAIPAYLSSLPIQDLLKKLEDAQYIYPIQRREINFPIFY